MGKLQFNTQILDDKSIIELVGDIDEDADFSPIVAIKAEEYHFDFKQVKMMNSCGVRQWIYFISELEQLTKLKYFNCPQLVVQQINMVDGFITENTQIVSLYAPYYCPQDDKEEIVLLNSTDIKNRTAPIVVSESCGHELEFDAIGSQYFGFLPK
jgi:anti-anti-sigma regulatory factor